jgi:hemerythrin superfamily protein
MDIFERLHGEHEEVMALLDALREEADDETVLALRRRLTTHLAAEEWVLYQRMRRDQDTNAAIDLAMAAHREARGRLSDVFMTHFVTHDEEHWPEALAGLRALLERHTHEEEERIFPIARSVLVTDEGELLTRRYDEMLRDEAA